MENNLNNHTLLLKGIAGSHAFGLNTEKSDIDYRGIFLQEQCSFLQMEKCEQIELDNNNQLYYELGRFIDLLKKNNPNVVEILNLSNEHLITYNNLLNLIQPEYYLSKKCYYTFADYAIKSIERSQNLNKKILSPMEEIRKSPLEFCYTFKNQGSERFLDFLSSNNLIQENCGLVNVPHMKDVYSVFCDSNGIYKGIISSNDSNSLSLSSVIKGENPICYLYYNKEEYISYCKKWKEYWDWKKNRNEERYSHTIENNKNYDSKNMMHLFRMLMTAKDIADLKKVIVKKNEKDRCFLLSIKNGNYTYEEIYKMSTELFKEIKISYDKSNLPDEPNYDKLDSIHSEIRMKLYSF